MKRTAELTYDCAHRKRAVNGGGMRVGRAVVRAVTALGGRPGFHAPHRHSRLARAADRARDPLPFPEHSWEDDQ